MKRAKTDTAVLMTSKRSFVSEGNLIMILFLLKLKPMNFVATYVITIHSKNISVHFLSA